MSKCTKCGCNLIGTAATPPKDAVCNYCRINALQSRALAAEQERDELKRERSKSICEHCGSAKIYYGPPDCPTCGAPICCQTCCKLNTVEQERDQLKAELRQAREKVKWITSVKECRKNGRCDDQYICVKHSGELRAILERIEKEKKSPH